MSKKLDEMLIERARKSPMAWTVQTVFDKKNFCEFIKAFALDALHDTDIQEELLKEEAQDNA